MGNIVKEVNNKMPGAFFRFYVLLPAILAITPNKRCATVQADFLFSFVQVRQKAVFGIKIVKAGSF